jgi:hypothetical protein
MSLASTVDFDTAPEGASWFQAPKRPIPEIQRVGDELNARVHGALVASRYAHAGSTYRQDEANGTFLVPHHGRIPEIVNRSIRGVFPQIVPAPAVSLQPLQEWEGYVTEVRAETFAGRLTDLTAGRKVEEESGEFPISDVADDDRELLVAGAVFRWVIGYLRTRSGTKRRVSQITFRRLPAWTARDLDKANSRATELASQIVWD